ncbi:TIGR04222 domain-containing membrane protein [Streptomyces sp. NPDC048483]|uniref:TIGR04222 domain-containing membrane protein n=1 Tax=Streptomyces sp. NPDC048483 TaxID=3154927 RepID=UPI00341AD004
MTYPTGVFLAVLVSSLVLIIGTVAVRRATPPRIRPADAPTHDVREIAFLAGGPGRVVDSTIAQMHEDGRLAVGGPGVVTVRQAVAHHAVETAVLDAVAQTPGGALPAVRAAAMRSPAVQGIGNRLAARGLMRHPQTGRGWRAMAGFQVAGCVALGFVGLVITLSGADGNDEFEAPTVFVIAPVVVIGMIVASTCKKALARRITKAGTFVLKAARAANSPSAVHGPGAVGDVVQAAGIAVALGGAAVIADELVREQLTQAQRAMVSASATPSSTGSSSSSCGWVTPDGGSSWCGSSGDGSSSGCGSSSCGGGGGGSSDGGGSSCGGGGSSCGGGGSSCGGGGSSCGGGGSSCGGG